MKNKKEHLSKIWFSVYLVFFFLTWSLKELFIVSEFDYLRPFLKILIWIIPVFFFLKIIDRKNPWVYLKLNKRIGRRDWKFIGLAILFFIIYDVGYFFYYKQIDFHWSLSFFINAVLLAGVTEEVVFRGFFLQKFSSFLKFWPANALTALLFALIHLPYWFAVGKIVVVPYYVFTFGLAMGYLMRKSKSLWPCIIVHSLHNLFIFV